MFKMYTMFLSLITLSSGKCPLQKQPPEVFYKKVVVKKFTNYTEKSLY